MELRLLKLSRVLELNSEGHFSLLEFEIREVASDSLWVELPKMLDVPRVRDF